MARFASLVGIGKTRSRIRAGKLDREVSKTAGRALFKIGGYIRTTMRRLLRYSARPSSPGDPPNSHTGLLRDNIFFVVDDTRLTVGPALIATGENEDVIATPHGGRTVPEVLEFGGLVEFYDVARGQVEIAVVEPRPFIGPAFNNALNSGQIRRFWEQL